jgi:hypothetical protein
LDANIAVPLLLYMTTGQREPMGQGSPGAWLMIFTPDVDRLYAEIVPRDRAQGRDHQGAAGRQAVGHARDAGRRS